MHASPPKKIKEIQKRFWVRNIYSEKKQNGEFNMFVKDLQLHDELFFFFVSYVTNRF